VYGENSEDCNRGQHSRVKRDKTYQIRVEYYRQNRTEQNRTEQN
jgi:hypothetical protein